MITYRLTVYQKLVDAVVDMDDVEITKGLRFLLHDIVQV